MGVWWVCVLLIWFVLRTLLKDMQYATGFDRFKRKVFVLGLGVFSLCAALTNVYFPLFGVHQYGYLGPYFIMVYVSVSTVPLLVVRPSLCLEFLRRFSDVGDGGLCCGTVLVFKECGGDLFS